MTLEQRVLALAQAIGGDIKTLSLNQGNLAALNTTAKGSLVAAINELQGLISGASSAEIDDAAIASSTTKTYSASKISTLIAQAKSEILGGASSAFDTLLEIQNALSADDSDIAGLLTAVGNRVRFDASQTLTTGEKLTAATNIGVGNTDRDFVSDYNTAKA